MKDYFYLNVPKMLDLSRKLDGSELKVLLLMIYYMSITGSSVFINCEESRSVFAQQGYDKTSERISSVLSSLVKKDIVKRKTRGVFVIADESLFKLP